MTLSTPTLTAPKPDDIEPVAALFLDRRTGSYFFTGDETDKALIAQVELGLPDLDTMEALRPLWSGSINLVSWTEISSPPTQAEPPTPQPAPKAAPAEEPPVIAMQPDLFGGLSVVRKQRLNSRSKVATTDRERRARLEQLQQQPDSSITIVKFSSGLVSDGMELPIEYVVERISKEGKRSFVIRVRGKLGDACIWAAGPAWAYLASHWPYMRGEVDERHLLGREIDLTYKIVSANPDAPQAEIVRGPSWDDWKPSLL